MLGNMGGTRNMMAAMLHELSSVLNFKCQFETQHVFPKVKPSSQLDLMFTGFLAGQKT